MNERKNERTNGKEGETNERKRTKKLANTLTSSSTSKNATPLASTTPLSASAPFFTTLNPLLPLPFPPAPPRPSPHPTTRTPLALVLLVVHASEKSNRGVRSPCGEETVMSAMSGKPSKFESATFGGCGIGFCRDEEGEETRRPALVLGKSELMGIEVNACSEKGGVERVS